MGIVSSIRLLHNQLHGNRRDVFPFVQQLESGPFTVAELYSILQPKLEHHKQFTIKKHAENEIEINEIVEGYSVCDYETFHICATGEADVSIKSKFLTPELYKLLSLFTVWEHDVHIAWYGIHPFLSPRTILNYKEGHYHYACILAVNEIYAYIKDTMHNFKRYNDYWDLTLFHDLLKIELNNYSSAIYEGENKPQKEAFSIHINQPQQPLKILKKATSENNGNYYFSKISYGKALKIMNSLLKELKETGTKQFLTAFNPKCQSYSEITATIQNTTVHKVAELIENSNSFIMGAKIEHARQQLEGDSIKISSTYKTENTGYAVTIKNENILEGNIHLGKWYDETLFETIQKSIAQNFCPCFIVAGDTIKTYYRNEHDKKLIEDYYKSVDGYEDWFDGFVKV